MKAVILVITAVLCYCSVFVFGIWCIVSFLIYLVKDEPFNWTVFWCMVAAIPVALILLMARAVSEAKSKRNKTKEKMDFLTGKPVRKSKFQQRMDEMKIKNDSRLN